MFDRIRFEKEHKNIFDEYRTKYQNRSSYLFEDGVVDLDNYSFLAERSLQQGTGIRRMELGF